MAKIHRIEINKALSTEEVEQHVAGQGGLITRIDMDKKKTVAYFAANAKTASAVAAEMSKLGKTKKGSVSEKELVG